jgi:hypothetical protein
MRPTQIRLFTNPEPSQGPSAQTAQPAAVEDVQTEFWTFSPGRAFATRVGYNDVGKGAPFQPNEE